MQASEARKDLARRLNASGIKKHITPHSFRHTFITLMLRQGCPLPLVQQIVGHENLSTTSRYIHLDTEMIREAMVKFYPRPASQKTTQEIFSELQRAIDDLGIQSDPRFYTSLKIEGSRLKFEAVYKEF